MTKRDFVLLAAAVLLAIPAISQDSTTTGSDEAQSCSEMHTDFGWRPTARAEQTLSFPASEAPKLTFQPCEISLLGRGDERFKKTSLLGRTYRRTTPVADMLASSGNQLAGIRFFELQNFGNLSVGVVERFPENIRCPLSRREFLEQ